MAEAENGYFVGRMNPIHVGHERVIDHMLDVCGPENSTVVIGSSNATTSMRHFFNYVERRDFVRTLYPEVSVIGIPDYPTDADWLTGLNDLIEHKDGRGTANNAQFFGGSDEDVGFFLAAGRRVKILNRFDGSGPKISASEIRDSLLHQRSLEGVLNPLVAGHIAELFGRKWQTFKNT